MRSTNRLDRKQPDRTKVANATLGITNAVGREETDSSKEKTDPLQSTDEPKSGNETVSGSAVVEAEKRDAAERPAKKSTESTRPISEAERQAYQHARRIISKLEKEKGKFLRDEDGGFFIELNGNIISLCDTPGRENLALDELLSTQYLPGTSSPAGRYTVRWLKILAARETKNTSVLRRFSALSKDEQRLYVPVTGGLLRISATGIETGIKSGDNKDRIVLELAEGQQPFSFGHADPREGLEIFEKLIVDAQAVIERAMAWLLAM